MRIESNQKILNSLGEPPHVTEKRNQLVKLINTLDASMKVIQRDPDITAAGVDDDELSSDLREMQMQ